MSDFLNSNKLRNEENTLESSYNCGGYALRTFSWYLPYSTSFVDSEQDTNDMLAEQLLFDGFSIKEIYQIILNKNVNFMLQDFFENLRVIKDINDLKDTEELVAFRIGIEPIYDEDDEFLYVDTDFHYRVFRDNKWLEKCGEKSIQSCSNITDIWEIDNFYYDSDIVFLAHELTK